MATYYNPSKPNNLRIKEFGLPDFANRYLQYLLIEKNAAPGTIFNYAVSIRTFLRWVKMIDMGSAAPDHFADISVQDLSVNSIVSLQTSEIYDFLAFCKLERSCGSRSRSSKLAAVRSLYDYLRQRDTSGLVITNPATDISSPKKEKSLPVFLTVSESKQLLGAVSGPYASRDYCILLWFLSCGMRLSELVAINLPDIKDDTLRLHGKGRKERIIHLSSPCLAALDVYLIDRTAYLEAHDTNDKEALFISMHSNMAKRLTGRRVEQIVDKYVKIAGLQGNGFSAHKLRHTAATMMYRDAGAGVLEIQEILGHENVQTTTIYTHTSGELVKKALDSIGDILEK